MLILSVYGCICGNSARNQPTLIGATLY